MHIGLIKQILFWEMREAVENYNNKRNIDFNQLNYRIEQLLNGAENCKEMIDNRRKISDSKFYSMLNKFAYISDWNEYDCYNVLEMAYKTKFVDEVILKTTMHAIRQKNEEQGRNYNSLNVEVGINFKILYTECFKIDHDHFYTIKEIKKLIDEKQILIVSVEERYLFLKDNYKKEKYQKFDYAYDDYNMQYEFFNESGKFYKYTLKYIKKKLNSRQLKKLFSEHLNHVEREVCEATDGKNYCSDSWSCVAKEYSKEFEDKGYAKRLKKLTTKIY